MTAAAPTVDIRARDVTGQRKFKVSAPAERSVAELVRDLLGRMGLVSDDHEGRPLAYRARLEREGRQLHGSERVGDALRSEDEVVISPFIAAG